MEQRMACWCQNTQITEETVVKAIKDGATTLEALKEAVGVTTGACQGKKCTPVVTEILARELA